MIIDSQSLFSDAQAVTAAAASTNYIDLKVANAQLGNGEPLYIHLNVDVALTDSGSDSTVAVTIEQDDNTSFSSATSVQTLFTVAATAAAGTVYKAYIAPGVITERYIRLYYTPANGNLTTGSFTAAIVHTIQDDRYYPNNYTIS